MLSTIDGECPDGLAMNEDGQCYPNKPCLKGYERRDNDETVGDLNGKQTFNFKAREVPIGGTFEVCA